MVREELCSRQTAHGAAKVWTAPNRPLVTGPTLAEVPLTGLSFFMHASSVLRCTKCGNEIDSRAARGDASSTCGQCGARLTVFAEDTIAPGKCDQGAADAGLDGLRIPGYEIKREIGRGGMGYVFEALQKSLDRSVAIKVLAPKLGGDPQFAARFEAEASALARLAHPNIVSIYERGRCDDRLYFVMEYVAGDAQGSPVDLKGILAKGPLGNEQAKRLIVQVMRALAVAHNSGIVHRDIKPGNILIDRHGTAKVADFGIAIFNDEAGRTRFTQPAVAMGTYDYMAPEQRINAASSDGRSDVYSTATMLYEMLTGSLPFGAFQPPSKVKSGVHPSWDAIVARGMNPLPEERYATMAECMAAVECLTFAVYAVPMPVTEHPGILPREVWRCPECRQVVRDDARFCPSCRAAQFMECAGCGARMRTAVLGCEQCGADLQKQRSYERFYGVGLAALERARTADLPLERIHAAVEAGVALIRARKVAADETEVARLLDEANHIVESLATQLAEQAVSDSRYREAVEMLDMVLDVVPGRKDATMLRQKLVEERERGIADAISERDAGRPQKAVRLLSDLAQRFADDEQINGLLRDCQRRFQEVAAVVRETMPGLVAARKWWAVNAVVQQLQAERVQVQGLRELADRAKRTLNGVGGAIKLAEDAIAGEEYTSAIRQADTILGRVADHPRAIELRASAIAARDKNRELLDRIRCTLQDGRAFKASHLAKSLSPHMRSLPAVKALVAEADVGIERANRFTAVVIAGFVGLAVTVGAFLWRSAEIKRTLRDVIGMVPGALDVTGFVRSESEKTFGSNWPEAIASVWGGVVAIGAFSYVLQRPVGPRPAGIAGVCGVSSIALASLMFCMAYGFHELSQEPKEAPQEKQQNESSSFSLGTWSKQVVRPLFGSSEVYHADIVSMLKIIAFQLGYATLSLGLCLAAIICLSAVGETGCPWLWSEVAVSAVAFFAAMLSGADDKLSLLAPCVAWISVTGCLLVMWSRRDAIQFRIHLVDRLVSGQWGLASPAALSSGTQGSRRS